MNLSEIGTISQFFDTLQKQLNLNDIKYNKTKQDYLDDIDVLYGFGTLTLEEKNECVALVNSKFD